MCASGGRFLVRHPRGCRAAMGIAGRCGASSTTSFVLTVRSGGVRRLSTPGCSRRRSPLWGRRESRSISSVSTALRRRNYSLVNWTSTRGKVTTARRPMAVRLSRHGLGESRIPLRSWAAPEATHFDSRGVKSPSSHVRVNKDHCVTESPGAPRTPEPLLGRSSPRHGRPDESADTAPRRTSPQPSIRLSA